MYCVTLSVRLPTCSSRLPGCLHFLEFLYDLDFSSIRHRLKGTGSYSFRMSRGLESRFGES